ncbi:hypothetical protein MHU86_13107 [Fragilaria crotonensis]|nr:hypothetical protein MHU86_13107 [Fragilaria crotonensis]
MTEPTATSGASSRSSCSPSTKIVMNGDEVHSQQRLTNQQQQLHNLNRTALAISVTTGSRGEPGGVNPNCFAAQYQQSGPSLSMGVEAMLQSSQRHGLHGTSAMVFCGGGITLPEKRQIDPRCLKLGSTGSHNQSQLMPSTMATHQARKVVTIISAPQTKPKIVTAAPSPSDVIIGIHTNNTKVYSSACRASVDAHQLALTRRVNSAPGLAGRTGPSDLSVDRSKFKYQKVIGGSSTNATNARRTSLKAQNELSPQVFLDTMLKSRGYSTQNFCSLEGAYYCKPTALQQASYGIRLIEAIRRSDEIVLQKMLQAGLSPNPCNSFGESIVHMLCRRGDYKLLKLFKEHGCSLQVTDDFGRTPLHDACWTTEPPFDIVDMILTTDRRLLHLVDCRGSSPLSYVSRNNWEKWIAYLQSRADTYWPPRNVAKVGDEPAPPFCWEAQHSRPIPDPPNAISIEAAKTLVSLGEVSEGPSGAIVSVAPKVMTSATIK